MKAERRLLPRRDDRQGCGGRGDDAGRHVGASIVDRYRGDVQPGPLQRDPRQRETGFLEPRRPTLQPERVHDEAEGAGEAGRDEDLRRVASNAASDGEVTGELAPQIGRAAGGPDRRRGRSAALRAPRTRSFDHSG